MIASSLMLAALLLQTPQSTNRPAPSSVEEGASVEMDVPLEQRLLKVKRIYVEPFGDDPISKQIQDMVVTGLTETKRFIVTENKERADAVLKGSGTEKTSHEVQAFSDATAAGHAAISDSSLKTETVNDARIAVRLVDREGDVIWTTSQESKGAKYKGATGDVADKVVKQLMRDLEKAEKKFTPSASAK